eukprot:gene3192-5921_t
MATANAATSYYRLSGAVEDLEMVSDGMSTETIIAQREVEERIENIILSIRYEKSNASLTIDSHLQYAARSLNKLSSAFECLDASRPWLIYWNLNTYVLLGGLISEKLANSVIETLSLCQSEQGGFGGGIGQLPHTAPTYAAINALAIIGSERAWGIINRQKLTAWLSTLIEEDGSMRMHQDGEFDVRAVYCGASAAHICCLDVSSIFGRCARWVASACHTQWSKSFKHSIISGKKGRPNKLVDGCYSFWVGGCFGVLKAINTDALVSYVICSCQCVYGFRDKPGKSHDHYHTCYCLSGLSSIKPFAPQNPILGLIQPTHPIHNVPLSCVDRMQEFFRQDQELRLNE